jgi:phage-related tail fiber protein
MDFIQTSNKQVDKFGAGKHGFTAGNPGTGALATFMSNTWCDGIQQEIINVIEGAGLVPSGASLNQMYQAIQSMIAATIAQDYKASVRAATTANIAALAGGAPNTLDGVALAANDRILVKDQTTGSQNGIYVVTTLGTGANGTWSRAGDADQAGELTPGAVVMVEEGTSLADSQWEVTTDSTITVGTTAITFARKDAGAVSAGQQPGEVCYFARNTAPTGFLKANGAAISRTTYAALFAAIYKSATVTMTIAAPGVITWNSHGLSANDPVQFTTTGALPTGFVTATQYFVVGASITTNTFQLSATAGGTAITTTGSQSGIHTAHNAPFGIGDGTTTFNVPDLRGEFLRGWDDSRAVDASRAFGSLQLDQFQGHYHGNTVYGGSGGPTSTTGGSGNSPNAVTNITGPVTDGTNGTPRTGAETRPRNVAMLACIKY